jgi:hypothetical protein
MDTYTTFILYFDNDEKLRAKSKGGTNWLQFPFFVEAVWEASNPLQIGIENSDYATSKCNFAFDDFYFKVVPSDGCVTPAPAFTR